MTGRKKTAAGGRPSGPTGEAAGGVRIAYTGEPEIVPIRDGWAALGDGWAVFGPTREEARLRYGSALLLHAEIAMRPRLPSMTDTPPSPDRLDAPTTEAGKRLWEHWTDLSPSPTVDLWWRQTIVAIEQEARAAAPPSPDWLEAPQHCGLPSSVSDHVCVLPAGHSADSATRFHRFGPSATHGLRDEIAVLPFHEGRREALTALIDAAMVEARAPLEAEVSRLRTALLALYDATEAAPHLRATAHAALSPAAPETPDSAIVRFLRAARTRRSLARALGGGDQPPDECLTAATAILAKMADEEAARPWNAPAAPETRGEAAAE